MTETKQSNGSQNAKRQLLLLIGIALLATVVPYIMYYTGWGVPQATTNQGVLVSEPILLTDFHFEDAQGRTWNLAEQTPKFRLVIPVYGECTEACQQTLYLTRQVRRRLSDKSAQLDRLYVQLGETDSEAFLASLADEHPELVYLRGDYGQWKSAFGERNELSDAFTGAEYYLLHRYGALGLAYNAEHSGNQLLVDLEFLIKTSN